MSKEIVLSKPFKRDAKKHYLELVSESWAEVLNFLINDVTLPTKYKDHALKGKFVGCRDCHIKPDLVLIYEKHENELLLIRLGSHSEFLKRSTLFIAL